MALFAFSSVADDTKDVVSSSVEKSSQKEESGFSKYFKNDLEPFAKSINADIDNNWKYYMIEPIERLERDGDLEAFRGDMDLLIKLYSLTVANINNMKIPDTLETSDRQDIMEYRDELSKAVGLRLVIAKTLVELDDADKVIKYDASKDMAESEQHLKSAAKAFERAVKRNIKASE
ncbi:hypothetical protein J27TS7_49850 [Paenibacillus dendritiformis]|nr:hypothetical protein J27TS7_49850 [Paenibacillus dendritiformis]